MVIRAIGSFEVPTAEIAPGPYKNSENTGHSKLGIIRIRQSFYGSGKGTIGNGLINQLPSFRQSAIFYKLILQNIPQEHLFFERRFSPCCIHH
jgi:hypothetical protein